jgi:hypothetical protein
VSSAYTVNEDGFMTPTHRANATGLNALGHRGKFANSYPGADAAQLHQHLAHAGAVPVATHGAHTVMGFLMATIPCSCSPSPKDNPQGINNRLRFFIFTVYARLLLLMQRRRAGIVSHKQTII